MRLRVTKLAEGPGPGEVVVVVDTFAGNKEQVIIDNLALEEDTIDIGCPIHALQERSLVELPRESMSGKWRLWVPRGAVV